jgi:hypothetical protein
MKPAPLYADKARAAWGDELPDWVLELAEEADRTTGAAVSNRIGYSPAVVSAVISKSYRGDLSRVEARVRGALMGATVECSVLGEIARDRCFDEQSTGFAATSSVRSRLYRACRSDCLHSRIKKCGGHTLSPAQDTVGRSGGATARSTAMNASTLSDQEKPQ